MMSQRNRVWAVVLLTVFVFNAFSASALAAVPAADDPTKDPFYPVFLEALTLIKQHHLSNPALIDVLRGAIKGAVESLGDPYTGYMVKEESEQFLKRLYESQFGGIGVHIELMDGYITVVAPISGSPAEAAGIDAGDRILSADGKSLKDVSLNAASNLLRGKPGTPVVLRVQKARTGAIQTIVIIRDTITLTSIEAELICKGKVGYVKFMDFPYNVGSQLEVVLKVLKDKGAEALLIDMRNNPGGLLGSALDVSKFLLPEGPVVNIVDKTGTQFTLNGGTKELPFRPVIYLVNGGTASASEIIIGSVQDTGVGHIVGTPTFGKGTIQQLVPLGNGDMLKLTIAKYLTRNYRPISDEGITPDTYIADEAPKGEKIPLYLARTPLITGDSGENVTALQEGLNLVGYKVKVTGLFDQQTYEAIKTFQDAQKIMPSGNADARTLNAVNRALRAKGVGGFDYQLWKALDVLKLKTRVDW